MAEIAIGFDPAFLDILVKLEDEEGNLNEKLPLPGHHHRMTRIHKQAGGNGVNIASVLCKLGYDVNLVIPLNNEFKDLLYIKGLNKITKINGEISETIAITWKEGEIQLNDVRCELGKEQWTGEIDKLWKETPIKLFTNWGLNIKSLEWVSKQFSSITELFTNSSDSENNDLFNINSLNSHILIEPGSLKNHPDKHDLVKILKHIMSVPNEKLTILLANEEEADEFFSISGGVKIIHSKSEIQIFQEDTSTIIQVPNLKCEPNTYLGAGDAFLSGIIHSILSGNIDPLLFVDQGIKTVQRYLCESI